jgi:predicted metalloprotease with PDZ domain
VTIRYTVHVDDPSVHRAQFTATVPDVRGDAVDLVLPSWVPGSYVLRPYPRGVRSLAAVRPETGEGLETTRVAKDRWRIATGGATALEARYEVYGHELITEGLDVTASHLFLNAALCLPYVDGRTREPHEVELRLPPDWRVYTELAEFGRHPWRFRAPDYDELVDAPIDCGKPVELGTRAGGVPHRIVLCGEGGNYEPHRLESDLGRIAEAAIQVFGECPAPRYTFFVHLAEVPDGGLEHATSTSLVVNRRAFRPAKSYLRFLHLVAHEYFHLWNVKRIRPAAIQPFDYTREMYTRLLWLMEGTTSYYDRLLPRRAGLDTPRQFFEGHFKDWRDYLAVPGRAVRSLEQSSFCAWVEYYLPYEESPNQTVSYYVKGSLVSLALDLEIRHRTENARTLDDVMRRLWTDYGRTGRGLEEDGFVDVVRRATDLDVSDFARRYLSGTEELPLARFLRYAGLELQRKATSPEELQEGVAGYLGIEFEREGEHPRIRHVLDGGPGRRGGLSPGDEILAVDGARVRREKFPEELKQYPPGTEVDLAVFRRGYLTHVRVTFGEPPPESYEAVPVESPTALEKKIYESWVAAPWTSPPKTAPDAR